MLFTDNVIELVWQACWPWPSCSTLSFACSFRFNPPTVTGGKISLWLRKPDHCFLPEEGIDDHFCEIRVVSLNKIPQSFQCPLSQQFLFSQLSEFHKHFLSHIMCQGLHKGYPISHTVPARKELSCRQADAKTPTASLASFTIPAAQGGRDQRASGGAGAESRHQSVSCA